MFFEGPGRNDERGGEMFSGNMSDKLISGGAYQAARMA
jgi:hypothetical protein